ncbi:MAG: CdaR family protein [Bryobacteraceae bacterium]
MRRLLFRNLGWKLAALAASCLLWVVINGANDLTGSVSAPVQYRNLPANLEIGNETAEQVHLILRGPSPLLSRAAANPSPVVLDLSDVHAPGEKTFSITTANVRLPGGVTLERAVPGQIRLRLERLLPKDVRVHVRMEHVPAGMRAVVEEMAPPLLTITGPENQVRTIDEVEADPIDVQALDKNGRKRIVAYTNNPRVSFTAAPEVSVRISLTPISKN